MHLMFLIIFFLTNEYIHIFFIKYFVLQGRSDLKRDNENIRKLITFLMAGIIGKQDCRNRCLCEIGDLIEPVKGKALIFV